LPPPAALASRTLSAVAAPCQQPPRPLRAPVHVSDRGARRLQLRRRRVPRALRRRGRRGRRLGRTPRGGLAPRELLDALPESEVLGTQRAPLRLGVREQPLQLLSARGERLFRGLGLGGRRGRALGASTRRLGRAARFGERCARLGQLAAQRRGVARGGRLCRCERVPQPVALRGRGCRRAARRARLAARRLELSARGGRRRGRVVAARGGERLGGGRARLGGRCGALRGGARGRVARGRRLQRLVLPLQSPQRGLERARAARRRGRRGRRHVALLARGRRLRRGARRVGRRALGRGARAG
jgi:hypothetical protein